MTKDERIRELLIVLDMSEKEQSIWLVGVFPNESWLDKIYSTSTDCVNISRYHFENITAGLVFRLRDEAVSKNYHTFCDAKMLVISFVDKPEKPFYWEIHSQPIQWIIAALIAKILGEKE